MSATMDEQIANIALNDEQVNAIIDYAIKAAMYDGTPPDDLALRRRDAATLVYQARRANANGNNSAHVTEVMFLADVDQKPVQNAQPSVTHEVSAADPPISEQQPQQAAPEPAQANGAPDVSQYTEEQLVGVIEALQAQAGNPAVKAEIDKLQAQLQQRRSSAQAPVAQEVPSPAPEGAPAEPPVAVASQPTQPPMPPAPGAPAVPEQPGPVLPGVPADAAAAPAVQAPQPDAQGQPPAAQADAEAGRRAALEAQISGSLLLAYGKTFADVAQISTDDLERMVQNPGGVVQAPTPPPQIPQSQPQQVSERESLIEQVTGPMLKCWKRGRVDIVGMSDDELREMVQYPGGPTTRPQGEGYLENPVPAQAPQADAGVQPTPTPAQTTAAQQPGEQPNPEPQPEPASTTPAAAPVTPPPSLPTPTSVDDLISGEKFPIAPEIDDPPVLPGDLSKCSDDQLRSVHGQFHAVLARVNWVIAQHKDEIFGLKRALAVKEVEARNALPKTVENKRVTKDEATAMVAADPEVVRLEGLIAEKEHPLIKLEAISENARSTCARCSREWSFRKGEEHPIMRGER